MDKEIELSREISDISKRIGMAKDAEKTVIHVSKGKEDDEKCCVLKSGSWEGKEPWFVVDEDEKLHTLVSLETLNKLVESIKATQEENFNLKLEKTIWQHIPVDFGDAWVVAMDELKSMTSGEPNAKVVNVNLNSLVTKIKKEHPNLFLDLDDFMPSGAKRVIHD